jgi:hypothetical protein
VSGIAHRSDLEDDGIVAKAASARYTPEATTWVKIKNRHYSQAVGRHDFFDLLHPVVVRCVEH